jgi:hypothetical protein
VENPEYCFYISHAGWFCLPGKCLRLRDDISQKVLRSIGYLLKILKNYNAFALDVHAKPFPVTKENITFAPLFTTKHN